MKRTALTAALALAFALPLGGCAVVTVASTAVSVTAGATVRAVFTSR